MPTSPRMVSSSSSSVQLGICTTSTDPRWSFRRSSSTSASSGLELVIDARHQLGIGDLHGNRARASSTRTSCSSTSCERHAAERGRRPPHRHQRGDRVRPAPPRARRLARRRLRREHHRVLPLGKRDLALEHAPADRSRAPRRSLREPHHGGPVPFWEGAPRRRGQLRERMVRRRYHLHAGRYNCTCERRLLVDAGGRMFDIENGSTNLGYEARLGITWGIPMSSRRRSRIYPRPKNPSRKARRVARSTDQA